MWRETTRHQRNLKIFREELDDFLPERILDFHVHVFNAATLPAGETYSCAGHAIAKYDFADLERDLADLYPGRQTAAVCFGLPHVRYDMRANNAYVAAGADHRRFFSLRLFDPHEPDRAAVKRDLVAGRFRGLKPYLDYVRKADAGAVEVAEMLPDWIMEAADELRLIVMLHVPRPGRLADPLNQRQVIDLCRRFPRANIVLAHVGRAYYRKCIIGHLDALKDLPNLYFDLAMVNNWEVLEYLFWTVSPEKLLYATDLPIALAPGKSIEINDQYTYITPVPWELSIADERRKLVFTSFVYEELRAIRQAVERAGLSRDFVRGLFYENGWRLLQEEHGP